MFKQVEVLKSDRGFRIELDGKTLQTPEKQVLEIPYPKLAEAISLEVKKQDANIGLQATPLTKLANSAVDHVRSKREIIIQELVGYANTDLLCYRVEKPDDLKSLQDKMYQESLDSFSSKISVNLKVTYNVVPLKQNPECLSRLTAIVAGFNDFQLAGLLSLTYLSGSIVLGVSMLFGWMDVHAAWRLTFLDEIYQERIWGEDCEASDRREQIKTDMCNSHHFISLIV